MSLTNRPLWFEGMFITPQHFQQQDRWAERLVAERSAGLGVARWGLRQIRFDTAALAAGRLAIAELRAVFADGVVVVAPDDVPVPAPRAVDPSAAGKVVHVGVPMASSDGIELTDATAQRRVASRDIEVRDSTNGNRPSVRLSVAVPNLALVLAGEPADDQSLLPVARIRSIEPGGAVVLDDAFLPVCLDAHAAPRLVEILKEVHRLLAARAAVLAAKGGPGRSDQDATGLAELALLAAVNRHELVFQHLVQMRGVHPETVYRDLVAAVGELAAYLAVGRRPGAVPPYVHERPETVFPPLLEQVQGMLASVTETRAIKLPLDPRAYGIWIAPIADRSIFQGYNFVLVARADVPVETVQRQFPVQIKVGPVEQIRDLVNLQLPGVGIRPLPVVPRELPVIADAMYFALDQRNELWPRLESSAAFAFHVSGNYPNLYMEFWAVRSG